MKIYLLLPMFCLLLLCCGDKSLREVKDESGKVVERYNVDSQGLKSGVATRYFPDGTVQEEANYLEGKLNGKRTIYRETGEKEIEEHYQNDILEGEYSVFYPSGAKEIEMTYSNGKISSMLKKYYESGQLMEEVTMNDNEVDGPFKEYYENGALQWEGNYRNGENEVGLLLNYDEQGTLVKKMLCSDQSICQTIWTLAQGDITPPNLFE